jgi:hypothetical protein
MRTAHAHRLSPQDRGEIDSFICFLADKTTLPAHILWGKWREYLALSDAEVQAQWRRAHPVQAAFRITQ